MSPANRLRALIAAQLVWVALTGIATRAERWVDESWAVYWLFAVAAIGFYPMLFGSPILAYRVASRAGLPVWKLWLVVGVEAAFAYSLLIALLPAVQ